MGSIKTTLYFLYCVHRDFLRFDKKIVVCIGAIDNFFEKQVVQLLHDRFEPKADAETSNLAATAIPKIR